MKTLLTLVKFWYNGYKYDFESLHDTIWWLKYQKL